MKFNFIFNLVGPPKLSFAGEQVKMIARVVLSAFVALLLAASALAQQPNQSLEQQVDRLSELVRQQQEQINALQKSQAELLQELRGSRAEGATPLPQPPAAAQAQATPAP